MNKQCDNFKGCAPTDCGYSYERAFYERIGFYGDALDQVIKDQHDAGYKDPAPYVRKMLGYE